MGGRSPPEALGRGAPASLPDHPQRRFPRIQLATTVTLRFASAEAVCECRTVDISEGGVFICMDRPRPEGTAIRLRLRVGARDLEIGGVVVRCIRPEEGPPTGIGVLFTEIRPEDQHFVQQLVQERLSGRGAGSGSGSAEGSTPPMPHR